MRRRTIPGTDLAVSEIGFGCGGNAGLMVRGSFAEQARAVAHALDRGITYFDTAPDYGDGRAEDALGRCLREAGGGGAAVVTTKVEVRRNDLGDVAGHVVRSAHDSLRRLGRDRIDVLQIHNGPTREPPPMEGGDYHRLWLDHFVGAKGAVEGLRRLAASGDIRFAGFVCRGGDGRDVRVLLDTGLFRMVNVPYTLLNPSAGGPPPAGSGDKDYGDAIGAASRRSCGAAVFSPLAGGVLAGRVEPHPLARPVDGASPSGARRRALADRFAFLADHCGGSLARAAYRFVLAHPGVTTVLGGFSAPEQIDDALAASAAGPLPAALMDGVAAIWAGPDGAEERIAS